VCPSSVLPQETHLPWGYILVGCIYPPFIHELLNYRHGLCLSSLHSYVVICECSEHFCVVK
jgi:hypothetical protein